MREDVRIIKVKIDTKQAQKAVDDLDTSIDEVTQSTDDLGKSAQENAAKSEKGFKGMGKGLKTVRSGFKAVGTAMKAAGIGLIIAAIGLLYDAISKRQGVLDGLATAFETVGIVVNKAIDAIEEVITKVSESGDGFESLSKTVQGFSKMAIAPLIIQFNAIKLAVYGAQLAWEKSFFGDGDTTKIDELNEKIKESKQNIIDAGKSYVEGAILIKDNIGQAASDISDIVTESSEALGKIDVKAAIATAKHNVKLKNTAQLAAAIQAGQVEQYDRMAEKQRQVRDNDLNTMADRVAANEELGRILEMQEKAMIKQADLQIASAAASVKKNNSIENQIALIEAQTNKEGILAQVEGFRSEQLANVNSLKNEQIAIDKAAQDAALAKTAAEIKAEEELTKKAKEEADKRAAIKQAEMKFALDATRGLLSAVAQVAGEGTALAKAAGIAGVIIDGARAVVGTWAGYSSMGPFGVAGAIAQTAAIGIMAVKAISDISKVKKPTIGGGGGGGGAPSAASTPMPRPSFNVIGRTSNTGNQIESVLAEHNQNPVKAYVVSSDMSSNQSLDRHIKNQSEM